ncbi:unconventional myosin-XVIIIa-like [Oreochromis aureus]|uniref:unconventional myosin-XVIIIa-like n=1 Tax=Oreochromis aureus TaxID=47969 RepID=UPI00195431FA|nr:unconventional myosin-XVIIIa-like [Oreochromis aureus]
MSLKSWFGFLVSPENLTSSPVICIGVVGTFVSGAVLLVKYKKTEAELKSKDEEIEELKTELEKLQWLRNDTLKGMDESQRKFTKLTLAIKRMEKLEEYIDLDRIQSLCSRNESLEKDLQTRNTELEASQSELREKEAELLELRTERNRR